MGALGGKVAIVTGAASGMGEGDASRLVKEGAMVVLTDLNEERGEQVARGLGENALFIRHDVTSEAGWDGVVAQTLQRFGRIDILVNNAGVVTWTLLEDDTFESFSRVMAINVSGTWLGLRKVVGPMSAGGGGSIINVSSAGGMRGFRTASAYCTSKWAVRGLTRAAAIEFAAHKIRVNSIHPGSIAATGMTEASDEATVQAAIATVPLGRFGTREEVADLIVFLASDASTYITGAEHVIDGGMVA